MTGMQIDAESAAASLADIDATLARVKRSAQYRNTSLIIIVWGSVIALANLAEQFAPRHGGAIWTIANAVGFAAMLLLGFRQQRTGQRFDWFFSAAILLFFGFGLLVCRLGQFGPRELDVFWPILFMFGYCLSGLWFGRAFILLGLSIALLAYGGYLFLETWFDLYLAVVNGGGLILAGVWMRRA
jgi:hypothetical protein